ncbi:M20/M25/M40 family metallo-hydrolase [Glaciecola sp. XM2]|uniref:M28 family metallopeptidase n=1 Tax=Glaciecola sp. XM2 TaxID=1914931 RepID=UPI001BDDD406|nr:M20/M25/M40 family metallo-hydrolase [Glaciecola sp. XM2]MBT1450346.1 M20/M25/M40 family metallo-hydrolase [Glaciecola sp. XM2]
MPLLKRAAFALCVVFSTNFVSAQEALPLDPLTAETSHYLQMLAGEQGIGVRKAGLESEVKAADYIQETFAGFGLDVTRQSFDYINRRTKEAQSSQNIIAYKPGTSGKSVILGAHYDSTSEQLGSLGAVDNAASVAVMMSIAKMVSQLEQQEYGVTFIAFGAEEVGLVGAYEFVEQASDQDIANYLGMINLDGIVGSDKLYIHSAHSTPYTCQDDTSNYAFDPSLREQLYKIATDLTPTDTFEIHPGFEGYPKGETGGWSDHAPFACAGIPIGNFESTNFEINGQSGRDGYSQSVHPALWTCFDPETMGACDREKEEKWGKIWHTGNDRLDVLSELFPGRIPSQLSLNLIVLRDFFTHIDKHVAQMQEK